MVLNPRSMSFFLSLAVGIAAFDQLVKAVVVRQIGPGSGPHERWLFGDWFGLSYAENSGVAFGLLRGRSNLLIAVASLAILVVIAFFLATHRDSTGVWLAGALIIGGAAGNFTDRIRLGYVRDFFAVGPWPQFNVADAAITVGVLIALITTMRDHQDVGKDRTIAQSIRADNRGVVTDLSE